MMAGVRDLEEARSAFDPLRELDYHYRHHRPRTLWFYKPASLPDRTHQLHLTEPGSDLWRERLAFRDALRADPALAAEYEELKLQLRNDADVSAAKRPFVARVLAAQDITLPPTSPR